MRKNLKVIYKMVDIHLQINEKTETYVHVTVFINGKNTGTLYIKKKDFLELCEGLRTIYKDKFRVSEN